MAVRITSPFGYFSSDSWVLSKIIQMGTMNFCTRFLNRTNDPCGRQFDQTTQAARAATANIAEGSARHNTSFETEMRLIDVARASLNEVLDDFTFFIMKSGNVAWKYESPEAQAVWSIRLDPAGYSRDMMHDVTQHVQEQYLKFAYWLDHEDPMVAANSIVILCLRVIKMLYSKLQNLLQDFEQNGGFTENMSENRERVKKEQSRKMGAPLCPECGEVMHLRTIRKGERQGMKFWGCSNFFKTGCKGHLPYNEPGGSGV